MPQAGDVAKRSLDLVLGAVAFTVTLPIQALTALAIRTSMGRPVLFRQERAGLHGRPFTLVKFRTMLPVDAAKGLVEDHQRLTQVGGFLRTTSLDELPAFWNVIQGQMSLVGPRPLPVIYLKRYSPVQARRHEVRPGVTGLAQVSGRNAITWEERLRLDVEYVDTHTLKGDMLIVMRTITSVLRRKGIAAPGSATMPEFTGTHAPEGPS